MSFPNITRTTTFTLTSEFSPDRVTTVRAVLFEFAAGLLRCHIGLGSAHWVLHNGLAVTRADCSRIFTDCYLRSLSRRGLSYDSGIVGAKP